MTKSYWIWNSYIKRCQHFGQQWKLILLQENKTARASQINGQKLMLLGIPDLPHPPFSGACPIPAIQWACTVLITTLFGSWMHINTDHNDRGSLSTLVTLVYIFINEFSVYVYVCVCVCWLFVCALYVCVCICVFVMS